MNAAATQPIVLFDGTCNLCSFWVGFILKTDRNAVFRLAPVQSEAGQSLLRRWGFPTDRYDTLVVIADGRSYSRSGAVLRIVRDLPAPWRWLRVAGWLPRPMRDGIYRLVARHRYRLFGRRSVCRIPDAEERARFLPGADTEAAS
ncbi:thiol-disulfide oxidoreductase DCC family protein [uncultured Abyssibacter sp.]|uniref:thiol-disulfide oxidoreductase DCC family protein n=1 Tax=uncultured Abyssibacter sp. TaxID=2320202 RepID=UPI0032B28E23